MNVRQTFVVGVVGAICALGSLALGLQFGTDSMVFALFAVVNPTLVLGAFLVWFLRNRDGSDSPVTETQLLRLISYALLSLVATLCVFLAAA